MKVTIVGAGNVGSTCADVIASQSIASEVVLLDIKDGFAMRKEDEADGRQRLADGALVPMLVKSIQELSAQNADLLARIETLEG